MPMSARVDVCRRLPSVTTGVLPPRSEHYDWRIPSEEITDPENVLLNNRNMAVRNFDVTVEQ